MRWAPCHYLRCGKSPISELKKKLYHTDIKLHSFIGELTEFSTTQIIRDTYIVIEIAVRFCILIFIAWRDRWIIYSRSYTGNWVTVGKYNSGFKAPSDSP